MNSNRFYDLYVLFYCLWRTNLLPVQKSTTPATATHTNKRCVNFNTHSSENFSMRLVHCLCHEVRNFDGWCMNVCSSWRQRLLWKITPHDDYCCLEKIEESKNRNEKAKPSWVFWFMLRDSHWVPVVWMEMKNFRIVLILFGQHFQLNSQSLICMCLCVWALYLCVYAWIALVSWSH